MLVVAVLGLGGFVVQVAVLVVAVLVLVAAVVTVLMVAVLVLGVCGADGGAGGGSVLDVFVV